ncbi:MAG: hypothetical protein EPN88_13850 [Bacteroidetes bacterium]|nr:MAG: hypothetical protein EPN88_13850 [Bacteroidota bacterium]
MMQEIRGGQKPPQVAEVIIKHEDVRKEPNGKMNLTEAQLEGLDSNLYNCVKHDSIYCEKENHWAYPEVCDLKCSLRKKQKCYYYMEYKGTPIKQRFKKDIKKLLKSKISKEKKDEIKLTYSF